MTRLTNDLLTLARLDGERTTDYLKIEVFDLVPAIRQALQSFEKIAEPKAIQLALDAPVELFVHGDPDKLLQVAYILVDNAVKYAKDSSTVTVKLSSEALKKEGQMAVISVEDEGIGMSKEEASRIFDRFYRADKARSRKEGGHGLGLTIAKSIVEAHNGHITVSSKLGKGSTFIVKVPQS